jgi:outer membrane protein
VLPSFCIAALVLLTLSTSAAAQALPPTNPDARPELQLATFSPQRAFAESAQGKTARGTLSALQAEKAREIETRNKRLETQRQALQQSATVLDEATRRLREAEIEKFQLDLKRFMEDAQAEFLGVQKTVEDAFLARLRPAVESVAKEKRLLLVIDEDSGALAWADPSLDITPDVVRRLNQP